MPVKKASRRDVELMLDLAMSSPTSRRRMARRSLEFLALYYLERTLYNCQIKWREQLQDIAKGGIIGPPDCGKTELIARLIPLDRIIKNRDIRICCISATKSLAKANGYALMEDLTNPKLVHDFGQFRTRSRWSPLQFQVRRNATWKEATFEAFGMDSPGVYGMHYDLIILDDIQNSLNVRNPQTRAFFRKYISETIRPRLVPGGQILILGNRQHPDDIYNYFIAHHDYEIIVSPALIREPDDYKIIELEKEEKNEYGQKTKWRVEIDLKKDPGEVLCPERWPMPKVLTERKGMPRKSWALIYQCEAVDDESAFIKWSDLQAAKDENLTYNDFNPDLYDAVIAGWDPSLVLDEKQAEAEDTAYSVMMAWGIMPNQHVDLIGLERTRGDTPDELNTRVSKFIKLFNPIRMTIETNNFGEIVHWNFKKETGIKLRKHYTGKGKHHPIRGVPGVSILFENGLIRLPYKTDDDKEKTDTLINELYDPLGSNHNDQVMASWITNDTRRWYLRFIERMSRFEDRSEDEPDDKSQKKEEGPGGARVIST